MPTLIVTLGVATAAWAAITGAGIVDGSITGRDIKSNSVPGGDIQNGSVGRLDLEPAERSEVIERVLESAVTVSVGGATVLSQAVPAGTWRLTGYAEVSNADPTKRWATCDLRNGSALFAMRSWELADSSSIARRQLYEMETTVVLTSAATVQLMCSSSGNAGVTNAQIIAERVGKLTKTGTWPIAT